MAKRSYKYDLSNLIKRGNYYDWNKSIGLSIPFEYDDGKFVGEFKVLKFDHHNGSSCKYLFLELDGKSLNPISPTNFLSGGISGILFDIYIPWMYNIGDSIDNTDEIIVTNRKRDRDANGKLHQYYQIKCLRCGFDSGEHYKDGVYKESYWIMGKDLKNIKQCPCCLNRIIVSGVNDVSTSHPNLKKYFYNAEEAKTLGVHSNKVIDVVCPHCGSLHKKTIAQIFTNNGMLACSCKDHISYPNKVSYYLFKEMLELNQIDYYETEYCPDWSGRYRYDNYIIIKCIPYIIEMDGLLGHGKIAYGKKKPDVSGKKRDDIKDKLAKEHGINIIRIDCSVSSIDYIKNSILTSELSSILNFDMINWIEIDQKCTKNIYKEICLYYDKHNVSVKELSEIFPVSQSTIIKALKKGTKFGWCKYSTYDEITKQRRNKILNYCLNHSRYSGSSISRDLSINLRATIKILHELHDDGLIKYNPRKRSVAVYLKDGTFLKAYDSIVDCVHDSQNEFGISFTGSEISAVCSNKAKSHKGYYFKYIDE